MFASSTDTLARQNISNLDSQNLAIGEENGMSTFWVSAARFRFAISSVFPTVPRNMGLNWFMPALVKRRVGSL
jgi:hypothetical protein